MAGFVAHLPLPRPNQLDRFAQPSIMVDPLLLDRLELLLVGLEQGLDRADRLGELLSRLVEEALAGVAQKLAGDLVELRGKALLGVLKRGKLLLECFLAFFL